MNDQDINELVCLFFAGELEGDLEYAGDSYTPTSTPHFVSDETRRFIGETQLLALGQAAVKPLLTVTSKHYYGWPSDWPRREFPRVQSLLEKIGPPAIEPICEWLLSGNLRDVGWLADALKALPGSLNAIQRTLRSPILSKGTQRTFVKMLIDYDLDLLSVADLDLCVTVLNEHLQSLKRSKWWNPHWKEEIEETIRSIGKLVRRSPQAEEIVRSLRGDAD